MTRERSHDLCQTGLLTRRVAFSICTSACSPEDAKSVLFWGQYLMGRREQENRKRKAAARSCQSPKIHFMFLLVSYRHFLMPILYDKPMCTFLTIVHC